MTKGDKAKELFEQGYNCAQAVFGAFAEDLGLDMKTATMLASSFGGGMGRMREVCGAVSGSFMAIGMKKGYSDPKDNDAKMALYALIQQMAGDFRAEAGSIICRELIAEGNTGPVPSERTNEYYKKRPCGELCKLAADIAENYMK